MTTVRFFAGAAEAAGCQQTSVEDVRSIRELVARLGADVPALVPVLACCSYLVDGHSAEVDDAVDDDSTVDVLPPFAGG